MFHGDQQAGKNKSKLYYEMIYITKTMTVANINVLRCNSTL